MSASLSVSDVFVLYLLRLLINWTIDQVLNKLLIIVGVILLLSFLFLERFDYFIPVSLLKNALPCVPFSVIVWVSKLNLFTIFRLPTLCISSLHLRDKYSSIFTNVAR